MNNQVRAFGKRKETNKAYEMNNFFGPIQSHLILKKMAGGGLHRQAVYVKQEMKSTAAVVANGPCLAVEPPSDD